jgi:hypothetical protein
LRKREQKDINSAVDGVIDDERSSMQKTKFCEYQDVVSALQSSDAFLVKDLHA